MFQATLILDGLTLISDDDASTWAALASSAFTPPTWYPIRVFRQPDYGPIYDNAILPSDSGSARVADRALYVLIGATDRTEAQNADRKLFEFTVQPGSEGEVLDRALDGRITERGLTTRMLDYTGATVDLTDNRVVVVPEPSTLCGLLGDIFAASLRHRGRGR